MPTGTDNLAETPVAIVTQLHLRKFSVTRLSRHDVTSEAGPFGFGRAPTRPCHLPGNAVVTILRVPPEQAGMRLDHFVHSQLKRTSRSRTQKIVERSAFDFEGTPLRNSQRVRENQIVTLWREPWDEDAPEGELEILYEDANYLAVMKPAGVPVHPTARYFRSTVVKRLEAARPQERIFLAHRLDRETSGVLLLTKNSEADRFVKKLFARDSSPGAHRSSNSMRVQKHYLAIAVGSAEATFTCTEALELDPRSKLGVKMRVAPTDGLPSHTNCKTLDRAQSADGQTFSMIACELLTGRQHQIRVHLAHRGLTLVGDKLYGGDESVFTRGADGELTADDLFGLRMARHALHAERLGIPRLDGSWLEIHAPIPKDMSDFWSELRPLSPA
jgi:23S rRNA pseudouridine1911/1915/1917 synthase